MTIEELEILGDEAKDTWIEEEKKTEHINSLKQDAIDYYKNLQPGPGMQDLSKEALYFLYPAKGRAYKAFCRVWKELQKLDPSTPKNPLE